MTKASIIIPVYNKGKYLKDTLVSVDRQTEKDLEVIIIDDASTDFSMDIISDFASNTRKQVKVIQNEKNQGVAYSRNIGIQESRSDYVTFLDADDTINFDFMEIMLDGIIKNPDVDFVRGVVRMYDGGEIVIDGRIKKSYAGQIIVPKMQPKYIYQESISSNGRLYNSSFIKNLRFVESSYEDYEFSLDTILSCTSILYTNEAIYNYREVDDGKSAIVMDNYLKTFNDLEVIYDRILEKYPDLSYDMSDYLKKKQLRLYYSYLNDIKESDAKFFDKVNLLQYFSSYLKHKYNMSDLDMFGFFGISAFFDYDVDEARSKIKEILMKYR